MLPLLTPYHLINSTKSYGQLQSVARGGKALPSSFGRSKQSSNEGATHNLLSQNFVRSWSRKKFMNFIGFYLQGGEVVQETITSNIHDDIITLEFQRTDGTLITQLIDFRSVSIVNLFPFLFFYSCWLRFRFGPFCRQRLCLVGGELNLI